MKPIEDLTLAWATPSNRAGLEPLGAQCERPWLRIPQISALLLALASLFTSCLSLAITYLAPKEFINRQFDSAPPPKSLWLNQDIQSAAGRILGHPYQGLRIRYWQEGKRTAWILDEVGKERPITIGVVIDDREISQVEILEYREIRGDEVRHGYFTGQFIGLTLNDHEELSGPIDGISGATWSVRAVTNVGRFALFLSKQVSDQTSNQLATR